MIKPLLSALVAATAFMAPVDAAGIHDFSPDAVRPRTAQQTSSKGNCYRTKDHSSVWENHREDHVMDGRVGTRGLPRLG